MSIFPIIIYMNIINQIRVTRSIIKAENFRRRNISKEWQILGSSLNFYLNTAADLLRDLAQVTNTFLNL